MNKLKAVIQFECMTSFKYIWIFYGIQYAVVLLATLIVRVSVDNAEYIGVSGLETNTFIYVGILGMLGYSEDFKMLIQNGFTRRYIFIACVAMFGFISGCMALVDTVVGNVLHYVLPGYQSIYGGLYGYENILLNWLWLLLLYMLLCSLFYLAVLVVNKAGKILSISLGVIIGSVGLLVMTRFALSDSAANKVSVFLMKAFGFMPDGTINHFLPLLTMLLLTVAAGAGAYGVIRKTELK
ncbi:hypothetical protein B5F53_00295 [Blautia sp. An249]|uniref:hypothetical protein n=1 Tax=Blautia sp. An249 TaxID=1965603 RepID=UPI000B38B3AF|nr:hypothetical protein [Blautia sp. An249]OUO81058.1 hypothetical protein B5F53_00295 [Blautia sp. An249]